jgi:hypothetical protein
VPENTYGTSEKISYDSELIVLKEVSNFRESCVSLFKDYLEEKMNGIDPEKY